MKYRVNAGVAIRVCLDFTIEADDEEDARIQAEMVAEELAMRNDHLSIADLDVEELDVEEQEEPS